jgi:hypothetical protein
VSQAEKESIAVHNAIQVGNLEAVRKSVADGYDVNFQNGRGSTALMTAVW